MTDPHAFSSMEPNQLGELLLRAARRDRAPDGARERTLACVVSVPLGALVAAGARASWAVPALPKNTALLAAKWVAVGLSASLLGLSAVDQLQHAITPPEAPRTAVTAIATASPAPKASAGVRVPVALDPAPEPLAEAPRLRTSAPPSRASAQSSAALVLPDTPSASQLPREVLALRRARAALASGNTELSREQLAVYRVEFSAGLLGTEAAALEVEVAFASRSPSALGLAEAFLRDHATSPLTERVRGLLAASGARGSKP